MNKHDSYDQRWFHWPWESDYVFPTELGLRMALLELARRLVEVIVGTVLLVLLPFIIVALIAIGIAAALGQSSSNDNNHRQQPQPAGSMYVPGPSRAARRGIERGYRLHARHGDRVVVAIRFTPSRWQPRGSSSSSTANATVRFTTLG